MQPDRFYSHPNDVGEYLEGMAVESFMEEMKSEVNTRYDRPVYQTDKEKDEWSR